MDGSIIQLPISVSDFGSLKSVLKVAKILKQNQKDYTESDILLKAITDTLMPKLSDDNIQVLKSVLADLFPDHSLVFGAVQHALKSSAVQVIKLIQLLGRFNSLY